MARHALPGLALAQVLGVLLADAGLLGSHAALGSMLTAMLVALVARRSARARVCSSALLVLALGAAQMSARLESARIPDPALLRRDVVVEAELCARHPTRGGGSILTLCGPVPVEPGELILPERIEVRVTRPEGGDLPVDAAAPRPAAHIQPGDRARWPLRLLPRDGWRNPGGRDRAKALARRGVGSRAILGPGAVIRLMSRARPDASAPPFREALAARLLAAGPGGGVLAALGLGWRGGIDPTTRDAMARLGLSHLLAVSGLHVGLVAAVGAGLWMGSIRLAPGLMGRRDLRPIGLGFGFGLAVVHAALCDFAIPVRRALIGLGCAMAAIVIGRRSDSLHAWSLALLIVLALDPAALFALGPQLSFGITAALLVARLPVVPEDDGRVRRLGHRARTLAHTAAIALAAGAPIAKAHGLASALPSLLANPVAIPATAVLLLPASLISTFVCAAGEGAGCDMALRAATPLASSFETSVVALAESLPAPAAVQPIGIGGLVLGAAGSLAVVLTRSLPLRVAFCIALVLGLRAWPVPTLEPSPPRIVMLDVGQGDALLVQGRSAAILIDGGAARQGGFDAGTSVVLPALAALGIERLDLAALSHADLDHRGGLAAVLRAIPVDALWLPGGAMADQALAGLLDTARMRGVEVIEQSASKGRTSIGDLEVEVLWPPASVGTIDPLARSAERNARSLVLRIEAIGGAGRALLAMGDLGVGGESHLMRLRGAALQSAILKVGHHGSDDASSDAFVRAVAPELALISAGCSARAILPAADALDRLRGIAREVLWTGRDGALIVPLSAEAPLTATRRLRAAPRACRAGE